MAYAAEALENQWEARNTSMKWIPVGLNHRNVGVVCNHSKIKLIWVIGRGICKQENNITTVIAYKTQCYFEVQVVAVYRGQMEMDWNYIL